MEAERESTEPTAVPPSAAVPAVLGDDDLLREILLRLAFPTALIRAALVSRRWLRHASDPAFLRRLRRPCSSASTSGSWARGPQNGGGSTLG